MSGSAIGDLREKMGELIASLKGVREQSAERHNDTRDALNELRLALGTVTAELRNIKHDERQKETVLANRVELLDVRMRTVETALASLGTAMTDLKSASHQTHERLDELRIPVDEMISIRRRITAYAMAVAGIATALWVMIQPIYSDLLKKLWAVLAH